MRLNLAIIPAPHEGAFGDEVTDSDHAEPRGVCLTRHAGEAPEAHKPCAISTTLADGRVLESDLVMLSIGVAPQSMLHRRKDRTIAHAPGSLLLLPMPPLARTLFDCIDCRTRRLDRVDDATRRVGGPLDRRGLHE